MIILMASTWIAIAFLALCTMGCEGPELERPSSQQSKVEEASEPSTKPTEHTFKPGLSLDLYQPSGPGPFPTLVLIHGGGWVSGSRRELRNESLLAVDAGFAVASVDYRLASADVWPAQIADCRAAVRYLRANGKKLHLKTDSIGAAGVSAGGHLSMWLGYAGDPPERVQAVCSISGIHDLVAPMTAVGEGYKIVQSLLGPNEPQGRAGASPINRARHDSPPTMFIHGTDDSLVPASQSSNAHECLIKLGVDSTLVLIPKMGHGLNLQHEAESHGWRDALAWFKKQLR